MKKKIVWLILSGLMALSLLMTSCAPAVTEEEEEVVAPPEEEEVVVTEEEVAPPPEGPTYGGVLRCVLGMPFYGFDEAYMMPHQCVPLILTHENLYVGDWAKGPAGTGEVSWQIPTFTPSAEIPCLCESWEMPDDETVIFHLRKGVHFHDKSPVNGREMTADDVVFTFEHNFLSDLPFSFKCRAALPEENIQSVEAIDKYTVAVKCAPKFIWRQMIEMTELKRILAPEAGGEYPGDFREWETCIGTGPFMIVDEVAGSSLSFVKNPNYWRKDPVHPENTLPYIDRVEWLIIPDRSTQLAALRTGKIERLGRINWEDRDTLVKTNPELPWVGGLNSLQSIIGMRVDIPELPFHDVRVRRALSMAIDRQTIAEDYYAGNAVVFAWPVLPLKEYKGMFRPLDEYSESIQELYEYNPEKARQLLAEAGYPNGFQTKIFCSSGHADLLSILKEYWADIGVDVNLEVRERGTLMGMSRTHKAMYIGGGANSDPWKFRPFVAGSEVNSSGVSDQYLDEIFEVKMVKSAWDWETCCQVYKDEVAPYILEKCWYIDPPATEGYTFWQPWLKGYHGEAAVGHLSIEGWIPYVWIDQELKKEMGR